MRAAIYARYSSDRQSDRSIDDQIRLCQERIVREGWTLAQAYPDYAISGATRARPGLQSMLDDARAGRLDVVVSEALDRLSRDQEDVAALFKRLRHAGVKIITLSEGEISELHVGLAGTMNALFLKHLADKTRRGQRGRVEEGLAAGGIGYGYRMVRKLDDAGEPVRGQREIDPAEAEVVRRIFRDYTAGISPRTIAATLNAAGIPSPRGGEWNASTINGNAKRGNGILWNELYLGRLTWNRQRFVKDPDTGKRQARPNPKSEWIVTEVPDLRIIDDATWAAAQTIKGKLAPQKVEGRRRAKRLLSGLMVCGRCGGAMTLVGVDRIGCTVHREKGTCDNGRTIMAGKLEGLVLDGLKQHLLAPELIATFIEEYQAEMRRRKGQLAGRRTAIDKELRDIIGRSKRILTAIEEGTDTPDMRRRLMEMEGKRTQLEREAKELGEPAVVEMHPGLADVYRRKVETLQTALANDTDPERRQQAITILRSLVDRVVLTPGEGRGKLQIELVGDLWSLMQLARQAEGRAGEMDVMTMVVAGAGFEPTTFRL